ncbi:hypothetical protein M0811_06203 [Anaeramoeba ignava]|uniref:Uncharacterized protein n=1 Tax=Anaeramoeba ignava TaxID=1746090 RepID=A0A9Q0LPJ7_ANAIG|nr:hypothetical protein M0811_06203 [Anaeramoeba ignava]
MNLPSKFNFNKLTPSSQNPVEKSLEISRLKNEINNKNGLGLFDDEKEKEKEKEKERRFFYLVGVSGFEFVIPPYNHNHK